ncbi:multiple sugar transport system substrate-binding protein [Pseudarthrobacter oxydans]|uniref:sugar ABC transporter substrate-binding protein n=1 Tax=Pseudarthrobacter oxydans TaxID=1671 RepID=UPI002781BF8D|nr:extracellular solute-binding protein [Pseudarthrobacter oxydans]MDP9983969.1 multiple sugar transport system substrate-binding protein [Pseudarthrobacter oxydans]
MNKRFTRILATSITAAALVSSLGACGKGSASATSEGSNEITMWTHNAGNVEELAAIQGVVDAYNQSSDAKAKIKVQAFPQDSYNDSVVSAAAAGKLPCIVDIDGPNVPNWAWAKYLTPLKLSTDLSANLPSTVAKWEGETYAVGHYDVALAMLARASDLKAAGVRAATIEQPWTEDEFQDALTKLKALGKWEYPLDMGTAGSGEWLPYGYSPLLQSFGADLINRDGFQTADGVLNGDKAVEWAKWFRGLADQGFMATKSGKDSTQDFLNNKSGVLYTGSWAADKARASLGEDLVVMPTVDLGNGPKIGGASWQWGVTEGCANTDAAMDYLSYSLKPENMAAVAKATGTIPATEEAAALIPEFAEGGANRIFMDFSRKYAVMRPETPAYPFIATEYGKAVQDVLAGADPQGALDKAVKAIDANIKSNGGYKN